MGVIATHQITTFAVPVNGATPIDANTVRGNDNTIKTAYNAHDNDTTIHVQNGIVSTRPAASIAGQMWLASDTGAVYAWLDTGSAWVEVNYLRNTGGTVSGNVIVSSGGITVTGNSTITGTLGGITTLTATALVGTLSTAAQPTVTSLGTLTSVTVSGAVTMTAAASVLIPGATSFSHRNNANNADNLIITDAGAVTIRAGLTHLGGATFVTTSSALTDYAAGQAGSLLNAPTTGDPAKWIRIMDNGVARYIPTWI